MISDSVPVSPFPCVCITYGGSNDGSEWKKKEREPHARAWLGDTTSRFDIPSFLLLGMTRLRSK
jgi:hypothetical protein